MAREGLHASEKLALEDYGRRPNTAALRCSDCRSFLTFSPPWPVLLAVANHDGPLLLGQPRGAVAALVIVGDQQLIRILAATPLPPQPALTHNAQRPAHLLQSDHR